MVEVKHCRIMEFSPFFLAHTQLFATAALVVVCFQYEFQIFFSPCKFYQMKIISLVDIVPEIRSCARSTYQDKYHYEILEDCRLAK
jgi:hypothetical protein